MFSAASYDKIRILNDHIAAFDAKEQKIEELQTTLSKMKIRTEPYLRGLFFQLWESTVKKKKQKKELKLRRKIRTLLARIRSQRKERDVLDATLLTSMEEFLSGLTHFWVQEEDWLETLNRVRLRTGKLVPLYMSAALPVAKKMSIREKSQKVHLVCTVPSPPRSPPPPPPPPPPRPVFDHWRFNDH